MRQPGRRLRLAAEASLILLGGEMAAQDHLDRDVPVQLLVPRLVDDPHAAAAELLDEVVAIEAARQRSGRRQWDGFRRGQRGGAAGEIVDDLADGEKLAQLVGEIGIAIPDVRPVDRPAGCDVVQGRGEPFVVGVARSIGHNVGPIAHGANSSSPTPAISLLVCLPDATSSSSSKIRLPTTSTGVPVRMTPASTSMSSIMCS